LKIGLEDCREPHRRERAHPRRKRCRTGGRKRRRQRRSRFDLGRRGTNRQFGYARDPVDATSDRGCMGAIRIVPLDRASFPLRGRGRLPIVFVRSSRCCSDLQSCGLVIIRDHDWRGSALSHDLPITVLEDKVNAKGRQCTNNACRRPSYKKPTFSR